MEQMNFHKQKLYALIAGAVGIISCFLPWWSMGFFGSVSGMHDLGIIVFLGFVGGIVCCFIGDKTRPFYGQIKLIAAGCFAGAALFTSIQFVRVSSFTTFGIWLSFLAGIAGAVIVYVLKPEQLENKKNIHR
jgi:hypothetical protein